MTTTGVINNQTGSIDNQTGIVNKESSQPTPPEKDQIFHRFDNYLYIGKNPNQPEIGDLKITFSTVKTGTVSVIGQQYAQELTSYTFLPLEVV